MAKKIERESFFSDRRGVESKSENGRDEIEVKLKKIRSQFGKKALSL